jgi:hypothetical protein
MIVIAEQEGRCVGNEPKCCEDEWSPWWRERRGGLVLIPTQI